MTIQQLFGALFGILLGGCGVEAGDPFAAEGAGRSDSALCQNALSPSQERTALQLIDDICGDTWCEGDNDFAFEHLTCRAGAAHSPNGGACTLELRIIPREDASPSYARVCRTEGFRGFDSLVETAPNGYQSLDWDYYLALSDCINRLEAQ